MMDPFERYVRILRVFLPRGERDDIIREWQEDYRCRLADAERARGRSLTDAERAAIVRQFGHPVAAAGRYWRQQHLIGPTLFPFYWPAVAAVLSLNLVVHVVAAGVAFGLRQSSAEVLGIAQELWRSSFALIGIVTIAFAWIERSIGRRRGAFVRGAQRVATDTVQRAIEGVAPVLAMTKSIARQPDQIRGGPGTGPRRSRCGQSPAALVIAIVFVAWWLLALRVPSLMFLTGGENLAWAPAMDRIYPAIAMANLLFLGGECLRRTSLHHSPLMHVVAIATAIADVLFLTLLLTSPHEWLTWQGPALGGRELDIVRLVNIVVTGVMLVIGVAVAGHWLKSVGRWLTRPADAAVA